MLNPWTEGCGRLCHEAFVACGPENPQKANDGFIVSTNIQHTHLSVYIISCLPWYIFLWHYANATLITQTKTVDKSRTRAYEITVELSLDFTILLTINSKCQITGCLLLLRLDWRTLVHINGHTVPHPDLWPLDFLLYILSIAACVFSLYVH